MNLFFFFFFFNLILYFWKSNLYSRILTFAFCICYQFCTFKNPIFSTYFYLGARLLAWLLSPPLDSPFSPLGHLCLLSPLLFCTQLSESLCIPDGGGHLGNWLLAGSVSLLFITPFYPPGHPCLLPPSSLLCITVWTSLSCPDCGAHIKKWLLASLLSPLLIPTHLIWGRRQWHPTPVLLLGKSHGQRSLVSCSPWGR